jgi:hypothetical protein
MVLGVSLRELSISPTGTGWHSNLAGSSPKLLQEVPVLHLFVPLPATERVFPFRSCH